MKSHPPAPGLLSVFRWFAALQLVMFAPALLLRTVILPTEQGADPLQRNKLPMNFYFSLSYNRINFRR